MRPCLFTDSQTIRCLSLTSSKIASTIGLSLGSSTCTSSCIQTTVHPSGLAQRSSCMPLWHSSAFLNSSITRPTWHWEISGSLEPLKEESPKAGVSNGSAAPIIGGNSSAGLYSLFKAATLDVREINLNYLFSFHFPCRFNWTDDDMGCFKAWEISQRLCWLSKESQDPVPLYSLRLWLWMEL